MDAVERIKSQLNDNPIMLYMKGTPQFPQCGFSGQAVQIMQACGAEFGYLNIFEDQELREALKTFSSWPTYPQLYIKGELIGGCDIMIELMDKGELQQLLSDAATPQAD